MSISPFLVRLELEGNSEVYYIHVSPVNGTIYLLAVAKVRRNARRRRNGPACNKK